jgi:6-phosphogluconate dehydrogenase
MQVGMIGLGRMGMNMARRLMRGRHRVVAYNRTPEKVRAIKKEGAGGAFTIGEMVDSLAPPRVVWIMLPAGKPVDDAVDDLKGLLQKGDTVVDGGNTYYKDDIRRAEALRPLGIHYMDAGVSGGVWGLKVGYCLMIGGERKIYRRILPLLKTLAPKNGYLYCGPTGSGHFIKMVHNGIEYGMMSAYGEGFNIIKSSQYAEGLDLSRVARLWNQGSVVRSWLLELAESALKKDGDLSGIEGYVEDSGEGRWTIHQAVDSGVQAPVITSALYQRFRSRREDDFSDKMLAALRQEFGGHAVKKKG